MAKLSIAPNTQNKLLKIFVQNNSLTTGLGLTGLTSGSSSLTWYYIREGDTKTTAVTLVAGVLGQWTSGGFIVVDTTNMAGVYEIGVPNAALTAGANSVLMYLVGATNMAPVVLEIDLNAQVNVASINTISTQNVIEVNASVGTTNTIQFDDDGYQQVDIVEVLGVPSTGDPGYVGIDWSNIANNTNNVAIPNVNVTNINYVTALTPGASGGLLIAGTNAATSFVGTNASGATPATAGITVTGGAASTTSGGISASGIKVTGGAGAASTNGAANGVTLIAGGTTTVSGGHGLISTGTGGNGGGIKLLGSGIGFAFDASPFNGGTNLSVDVNTINSVTCASVSVINQQLGTTDTINFTGTGASALVNSTSASNRKKGTTAAFEFLMQDSTTGAPKTGLSPTSTISKDGGGPIATSNAVTEVGLGQYQVILTNTEMTADNIFLQFKNAGAITANLSIQTVP